MRRPPPKKGLAALVASGVAYLAARRALLPFVASASYLVAFAARVDRGVSSRPWLAGAIALPLAVLAASPRLPGNGLGEDGRRRVGLVAYALSGLAFVVASLGSRARDPFQDLFGVGAALGTAIVASRALARIRGGHGIADSLPRSPSGQLAATVTLLILVAGGALAASGRLLEGPTAARDTPEVWRWARLAQDSHALAATAAMVVLAGSTWETLRIKRLVLGAGDRALTALGVILGTGAVATGFIFLAQGAADRVLRLAVAFAGLAVTFVTTEGDPEKLARRGRRAVALLLFGGPFVLLGGLAAEGPGRSELPLLVTGLVSLGIGSAIAYLELPLRRADGHLFDAVTDANAALVRADPETSVREALSALRTFGGLATHSSELWSVAPARVLTIDGAGYPHEREAQLPSALVAVARDEPEATLRTEVLEALVVRRPDLRPLARWMDERGALSATLITRGGEVEGVLVLPRGGRRVPMSLEEARAVKRLADAFAGAAAARAALERSLAREREAAERTREVEARLVLRDQRAQRVDQVERLLILRLAEPALAPGGPYSPLARMAVETMERRRARHAPMVVITPAGADVVPFLARVHLAARVGKGEAGPAHGPFVVVDGASRASHDVGHWLDPATSPLALARGGQLVLDAGVRLPEAVQRLIGEAMGLRRAPWDAAPAAEPLDLEIALTAPHLEAVRDGLAPPLLAFFEDALTSPIVWPRLADRGEDLRSIVLAGLARAGLCLRGAPLGIEDAAYERLADRPFPGDEAELRALLNVLAQAATGDVVRASDVGPLEPRSPP